MTHTNEEIAGGMNYDSQIEEEQRRIRAVFKASLLVSTALFAVFVFKSKSKPPTLH